MSAFKKFLDIPELVALVLAFLPWLDLIHLAHMNEKLRACVQDTVRLHILHILAPFINKDDQPAFWGALNACGGAVIGELPLLLMLHSPSIPPTALPLCEIMVPSGRKQALAAFLHKLGFTEEGEPPEKIRSNMVRQEDRPLYLVRSIEAVRESGILTVVPVFLINAFFPAIGLDFDHRKSLDRFVERHARRGNHS